ncbi:MAG: multifunctional CCA addition/repair protein [Pseudomonadales bacterium]|nr:multifunctional CCA addition/repair protein [Pseudomonadales bacterium]
MQTYLVGGAVRDKLLNHPFTERDWVVVGSSPEQMSRLGYKPVGSDFPVFLHPKTKEEYALARTERKSGVGYKGFQFYTGQDVTLEQDLERRDLTINAIAQDEQGNLIDPYHGQRDLENRVLRHVSNAFAEDPLRVLRVARFAARYQHLGFTIADETLSLMRQLSSSGELEQLTPERVWMETEKALSESSPRTYLEALRACGALKVLFPEVDCLFGVPQRADYHPEIDTGLHTLMTIDQAVALSNEPAVRFAAMVHDLGKGVTPEDILPRHIGHEERGVPLVKSLCARLKTPNHFKDLAIAATKYHLLCHKALTLRPATLLKLLKNLDAFRRPERFEQFLVCCEADAKGRAGFENKPYKSATWLRETFKHLQTIDNQPLIKQGLKGQKFGKALEQLQLEVIANRKAAYNGDTTL